ncbi:MAG: tryptophan halogenase [Phenylobacterium sp.]|jgi:tryptophan halogenase
MPNTKPNTQPNTKPEKASKPISKIIIVGGGTAGWMAAASLSRYVQDKPISITLIESTTVGTVGVGEATIPNIVKFNHNLGINEIDFIKATQATFKLGIQFEDWHQKDSSFFHPFADYGLTIDNIEFHHYLNRVKAEGEQADPQGLANLDLQSLDLQNYSFPCLLAQKGKFAQPHPQPPSPLADYSYAYHFDAGLYANFLSDFSQKQGVNQIDAKVSTVNLDADNGFIRAVTLEDGRVIEGDLFIDCSGFKGLLIEGALKTGYDDWSQWLPCDRAVAVQTESTGKMPPYTRCIASDSGWQWRIPLQHRMGNGYIYSSQFEDDDSAEKTLLQSIEGKPINQPRKFEFCPGRRKQIWHKNCFALGLASGFLEPLESTSISLIQTALAKLLTFFPDQSFNQHDIDEVNRLHNRELENIRDFLILHYKLTARDDTPFWQHCQAMPIPDSLAHKIGLFESRGHIVLFDHESFEQASWLTMYNGFKRTPQRYDERIAGLDPKMIQQKLAQMRQSMEGAAEQAMSHKEFIQKHCPAQA